MGERHDIGKRIKELRTRCRYSQSYVANKLFISQAAYSLIESAQNGTTSEHIIRLSKLFDVTADYLLTGNKKLIHMTSKNGFLPLIDAKAHAGLITNLHKEDVMDDFEYYKIPGYNPTKDSVLIEIKGDSMRPTILSGDVLICQTQHNLDYVVDGSLVVIVTDEDLFTKRIFKHEAADYFWLESDNPHDDKKKKIKRTDIKQLLMVIGKVSNVLIPHKELAYKGKIKDFEDNLDSLNQEIFKIKSKLDALLKKNRK